MAVRHFAAALALCVTTDVIAQRDGAAPAPAAPAPASATGAIVCGRVTPVEGEAKSEIVVYLEPKDAGAKFEVPAEPARISQKGAKFEPSLLVICAGQTVDFLNDEERPIEHNVFSRSDTKEFDLGVYKPGGHKSVTFEKPGAVKLFCSIHRYMDGVIYVCPTPYFGVADATGQYEIRGVPPGEYHVRTWQRKQRFEEAAGSASIPAPDAGTAAELVRIVVDLMLER